jgi:hypothetical protein
VLVRHGSDAPPSFRPEDLSEKWTVVLGTADGERLREELVREIAVGHPLHGTRVQPVAVRQHVKETIYWLPDEAAWAVVHLTWAAEPDPRWPTAVLLDTWSHVVAELADRGRT